MAAQGLAAGAFKSCQWAGYALKRYLGVAVDLRCANNVPAMPDSLFTPTLKRRFVAMVQRMKKPDKRFLKDSIVKKYNVTQVPCKPFVPAADDAKLHDVLEESRDGVKNFLPIEIQEFNMGANRGLLRFIKQLDDQRKKRLRKGEVPTLSIYSVDCNIFYRWLKVIIY